VNIVNIKIKKLLGKVEGGSISSYAYDRVVSENLTPFQRRKREKTEKIHYKKFYEELKKAQIKKDKNCMGPYYSCYYRKYTQTGAPASSGAVKCGLAPSWLIHKHKIPIEYCKCMPDVEHIVNKQKVTGPVCKYLSPDVIRGFKQRTANPAKGTGKNKSEEDLRVNRIVYCINAFLKNAKNQTEPGVEIDQVSEKNAQDLGKIILDQLSNMGMQGKIISQQIVTATNEGCGSSSQSYDFKLILANGTEIKVEEKGTKDFQKKVGPKECMFPWQNSCQMKNPTVGRTSLFHDLIEYYGELHYNKLLPAMVRDLLMCERINQPITHIYYDIAVQALRQIGVNTKFNPPFHPAAEAVMGIPEVEDAPGIPLTYRLILEHFKDLCPPEIYLSKNFYSMTGVSVKPENVAMLILKEAFRRPDIWVDGNGKLKKTSVNQAWVVEMDEINKTWCEYANNSKMEPQKKKWIQGMQDKINEAFKSKDLWFQTAGSIEADYSHARFKCAWWPEYEPSEIPKIKSVQFIPGLNKNIASLNGRYVIESEFAHTTTQALIRTRNSFASCASTEWKYAASPIEGEDAMVTNEPESE